MAISHRTEGRGRSRGVRWSKASRSCKEKGRRLRRSSAVPDSATRLELEKNSWKLLRARPRLNFEGARRRLRSSESSCSIEVETELDFLRLSKTRSPQHRFHHPQSKSYRCSHSPDMRWKMTNRCFRRLQTTIDCPSKPQPCKHSDISSETTHVHRPIQSILPREEGEARCDVHVTNCGDQCEHIGLVD